MDTLYAWAKIFCRMTNSQTKNEIFSIAKQIPKIRKETRKKNEKNVNVILPLLHITTYVTT